MPDVQHSQLGPGASSGVHVVHHWEVADAAARLALTVVQAQSGKVAKQLDDNTYWLLRKVTGGIVWARVDEEGAPLSSALPTTIAGDATSSAGTDPGSAHGDHRHAVTTGAPVSIGGTGAVNAAGSGAALALANHVHALAAADRTKLDALPATAVTVDTATAPTNADAGAGSAGSGSAAAAVNHKHQVSTSTPVAIGQANALGSGTALALATHVHDHGAQPLGTGNQHAVATTTVAGFCSAADKTKLDGIAASATNTPLSSTTPLAVMNVSGIGVGATAARHDHYHAHGSHAIGDGLQHAVATTALNGFMAAADKVKVDASIAGPTPATSTANGVVRYADTGARLAKNSGVTIDDSNNMSGVGAITASGALSGASCTVSGTLSGAALGGTVGSAPFVTIGNTSALAGERALTAGQGITITDGGANSTVTVATNFDPAAKADKEWTVIAHAAASLSITNTHRGALIVANMAGSLPEQSVVIPNDATLNLPVGFTFTVVRDQNWRINIDWLSGVYAVMDPNKVSYAREIGSSISGTKIGANRWWIYGDLADDVPDVP
jgi:hypothetical protein